MGSKSDNHYQLWPAKSYMVLSTNHNHQQFLKEIQLILGNAQRVATRE